MHVQFLPLTFNNSRKNYSNDMIICPFTDFYKNLLEERILIFRSILEILALEISKIVFSNLSIFSQKEAKP